MHISIHYISNQRQVSWYIAKGDAAGAPVLPLSMGTNKKIVRSVSLNSLCESSPLQIEDTLQYSKHKAGVWLGSHSTGHGLPRGPCTT